MAWKEYRSHKNVKASPITSIGKKTSSDTATVLVVDGSEPFTPNVSEMADNAAVGDYAVIYEDGYRSVSPKKAFEDGYTQILEAS